MVRFCVDVLKKHPTQTLIGILIQTILTRLSSLQLIILLLLLIRLVIIPI